MKKIFLLFVSAALILTACEEWQPVFTREYDEPEAEKVYTDSDMAGYGSQLSIRDLVAMYPGLGRPVKLTTGWIKGQVTSDDMSGNIYRTMYIQDETGGIEIKVGRTNLSNEYRKNQWVYVNLNGLTLGMYGGKTGNYGGSGMIQLGLEDQSGEYETAYIDLPFLVDSHVFKGAMGSEVVPYVLTENMLPRKDDTQKDSKYIGSLVTLKGLKYGDEVFALLYITYSEDTKASSNRIFLSDKPWGITTWALTKARMGQLLESGVWDEVKIGNSGDYSYGTVGDHRNSSGMNGNMYGDIERNAYSVSHYFKMGSTEVQLRSSGYARFADLPIDPAILDGTATVDVTGILTMYQGSVQFTLLDLDGVTIE